MVLRKRIYTIEEIILAVKTIMLLSVDLDYIWVKVFLLPYFIETYYS